MSPQDPTAEESAVLLTSVVSANMPKLLREFRTIQNQLVYDSMWIVFGRFASLSPWKRQRPNGNVYPFYPAPVFLWANDWVIGSRK